MVSITRTIDGEKLIIRRRKDLIVSAPGTKDGRGDPGFASLFYCCIILVMKRLVLHPCARVLLSIVSNIAVQKIKGSNMSQSAQIGGGEGRRLVTVVGDDLIELSRQVKSS
mmetsp:Transcript_52985/g.158597  ORF Transcript_52985/g.158597 Transcript_52985/m.158597 type:complete len:111 (+) Transcript_52985:1540-1872(+)